MDYRLIGKGPTILKLELQLVSQTNGVTNQYQFPTGSFNFRPSLSMISSWNGNMMQTKLKTNRTPRNFTSDKTKTQDVDRH